MSAEYKDLLSIKVVTDHDCGNYFIGECEVLQHDLQSFFESYGQEGWKELSSALTRASAKAFIEYRRFNELKQSCAQVEKMG